MSEKPGTPITIGHIISSVFDQLTVEQLERFETTLPVSERLRIAALLSIADSLGKLDSIAHALDRIADRLEQGET